MIYAKGNGRFGNQFFRNMYAYFLSEKFQLGRELQEPESLKHLGIEITSRKAVQSAQKNIELKENDLLYYLSLSSFCSNVTMKSIYCQTKEFAKYLIEHFPFYQNVWEFNPYKERYGNNDDVYVHYRIGDLENLGMMNPYEYYDQMLEKLLSSQDGVKRKGFITSDSPGHPKVKKLVEKYNLELIVQNLYETILFGSTCKHLILSLGTFSWLTGFLSQECSEVYYLDPEQVQYWHGRIFQAFEENSRWHKIELEGVKKKYFNVKAGGGMHNNFYTFPKEKIFFMHIPKTGGTSILKTKIPQIATYEVHQPISYNCPPSEGYQYFTVFRNPFERCWSFFKMVSKDYAHYRKFARNPEGFFRTCWEVQNFVTRYLAGYGMGSIPDEKEMFRRAKENMEKLVFIIDFELFETELKKFIEKTSNHPENEEKEGKSSIPHMRQRKYDTSIPFNIRKVIEEHNKYDIQLYKEFIKNKQKYQ